MSPRPHALKPILLLLMSHLTPQMPVITEAFTVEVPAVVEDRAGHSCLVVLPSDKPSTRGEALAVEALLGELLRDPANAAQR